MKLKEILTRRNILIAIVLIVIIYLGFWYLGTQQKIGNFGEERLCEEKITTTLEGLNTGIQLLVFDDGQFNGRMDISYHLPDCFKYDQHKLKLIERDGQLFLEFSSPKFSYQKKVSIPRGTIFREDGECAVKLAEANYALVTWTDFDIGILEGDYLLIREGEEFTETPTICIYEKK